MATAHTAAKREGPSPHHRRAVRPPRRRVVQIDGKGPSGLRDDVWQRGLAEAIRIYRETGKPVFLGGTPIYDE